MEAVNKDALLRDLENQVEKQLQEAIKTFQNLNIEQLLKASGTGGWSIAQCLEHLNYYGNFYLPHLENGLKKMAGKPNSEAFKSSWLGNYFTRQMYPETGKRKIKAFKDYTPPADLNAHAVVAEFIRQQEQLLSLLNRSRQSDLNNIKIPVSIAQFIKLKAGDVFRFLIAHNERHVQQAKRNLN